MKPDDPNAAAYDPRAALAFFKAAGKLERFAAGARIFAEKERRSKLPFGGRSKMYLLLDGQVALVSGRKELGLV